MGPLWLRLFSSPAAQPLLAPSSEARGARRRRRARASTAPRASGGMKLSLSSRARLSRPQARGRYDAYAELERVLTLTGCARLVVGHTPQPCVNSAAGGERRAPSPSRARARAVARSRSRAGRVWRIDTGVSRGIAGGRPEALEMRDDGSVRVLTEHGAPAEAGEREAR